MGRTGRVSATGSSRGGAASGASGSPDHVPPPGGRAGHPHSPDLPSCRGGCGPRPRLAAPHRHHLGLCLRCDGSGHGPATPARAEQRPGAGGDGGAAGCVSPPDPVSTGSRLGNVCGAPGDPSCSTATTFLLCRPIICSLKDSSVRCGGTSAASRASPPPARCAIWGSSRSYLLRTTRRSCSPSCAQCPSHSTAPTAAVWLREKPDANTAGACTATPQARSLPSWRNMPRGAGSWRPLRPFLPWIILVRQRGPVSSLCCGFQQDDHNLW